MFRIASRTLVMALGVFCLLAFAEPAAAQKAKRGSVSKAKSSQVRSRKAIRSRPSVQRPSVRRSTARRPSVQSGIRSRPSINVAPKRTRISTPSRRSYEPRTRPYRSRTGIGSVKPGINVGPQERKDVRARPRINVTPQRDIRARGRAGIGDAKARPGTSSRAELDARSRANRRGSSSAFREPGGIGRAKSDALRTGSSSADRFRTRSVRDRDRFDPAYTAKFRSRPSVRARAEARRRYDRLHRDFPRYHPARTYWNGFFDGYSYAYHRGYHVGFHHGYFGHHHLHHHYYGTHLVFGHHFGGFGFHHGSWHFAIVIGSPIVTHHRHYYGYSWWDGRGTTLVSWDRARQVYDEEYYSFGAENCVELYIITNEGNNYEIKIDPRLYDADDPGDLYAELWSELSTLGELRIQDLNGAVHIFPAGLIQQIEARGCR